MTADLKNEAQKALDAYDKYESHRDALQFAAAIESLRKAVELQAPAEAHDDGDELTAAYMAGAHDARKAHCLTTRQIEVLTFLAGEGTLDGHWFEPDRKPKFWWRTALREAFGADVSKAQPKGKAKCNCTAYCGQYLMHGSCPAYPAAVTVVPAPAPLTSVCHMECGGCIDAGKCAFPGKPAEPVRYPHPDEDDAVTLWAEIHRLRAAVQGPDGYATWQEAAIAERVRRVAAEKALAATQAPAPAPETGDTNGRRDGLRSAVHGRVPVGGHTPGALADLLWASPDVMGLNAELGLTMDQLVQLTQAVLTAVPCAAVGAATREDARRYCAAGFQEWLDDSVADGATVFDTLTSVHDAYSGFQAAGSYAKHDDTVRLDWLDRKGRLVSDEPDESLDHEWKWELSNAYDDIRDAIDCAMDAEESEEQP